MHGIVYKLEDADGKPVRETNYQFPPSSSLKQMSL